MKKILSLLAALTVAGTSSISVVACGSGGDSKHLNDKGNSVWAWLPGLGKGESPDSADVWKELTPFEGSAANPQDPNTWDGTTKAQASIQVLKILSVSILAHASELIKDDTAYSDYNSINKQLADDWTNLKASVANEVANKKQSYKDQYGKDWEKHWNDMLDKYDHKESNYVAYLYASSTVDNASIELTNTLLNSGRNEASKVPNSAISVYTSQFNQAKTPQDKEAWINNNKNEARLVLLSNTAYPTTTSSTSLWVKDANNNLKYDDVKNALEKLSNIEAKIAVPQAQLDTSSNTYKRSTTSTTHSQALVSQFQKFVVDKWYQQQKPLAVSTINIPFNTNATGGDKGLYAGLNGDNTNKVFKDQDFNTLAKIITYLNTDNETWSKLANDVGQPGIISYAKNVLTINPSDTKTFTPSIETSVYGSMNQLLNGSLSDPLPANSGTTEAPNLKGLFDTIKRDTSSTFTAPNTVNTGTMYHTFTFGGNAPGVKDRVVVYADDTGINIVHVDGLQAYLKSTSKGDTASLQNPNDATIDADNFDYNINKTNEHIGNLTDSQLMGSGGIGTDAFNNGIYSNYEQYLVNRSYINTNITTPKQNQSFNIMSSVKSFAALDANTKVGNHLWYSWIYDFFNNYFTKVQKTPDQNWLSKFIKFGDGSVNSAKWFEDTLRNNTASLDSYPISTLATNVNKANDTIEQNVADKTKGNYPNGYYFRNTVQDLLIYEFNFGSLKPTTTGSLPGIWYEGATE